MTSSINAFREHPQRVILEICSIKSDTGQHLQFLRCFHLLFVFCPFSLPCALLWHSIKKVSCWKCFVEFFHILYFVLIFGAMGITWRGGGRISGATPIVCAGKYIFTLSEEPAIFTQQPLTAGQFDLSNMCLSSFHILGSLKLKSF